MENSLFFPSPILGRIGKSSDRGHQVNLCDNGSPAAEDSQRQELGGVHTHLHWRGKRSAPAAASVRREDAVQAACGVSSSSLSLYRPVLLLEVDLLFSSFALTSRTWVRRLRRVQRLLVQTRGWQPAALMPSLAVSANKALLAPSFAPFMRALRLLPKARVVGTGPYVPWSWTYLPSGLLQGMPADPGLEY